MGYVWVDFYLMFHLILLEKRLCCKANIIREQLIIFYNDGLALVLRSSKLSLAK